MKKTLLPALLLAVSLSSCLNDVDDSTQSMSYNTLALISSTAESTDDFTALSAVSFGLSYNKTKQTVQLSLSDLSVNGGTLSFTTPDMSYTSKIFDYGITQRFGCESMAASGVASQVSDLEVMITSALNYPTNTGIGDQQGASWFTYHPDAMLLSLKAGDKYTMHTLPRIALYKGVTTISPIEGLSDGSDGSDSSEFSDIVYRVELVPASKLATIVIFNPQGATGSNVYSLYLKDLPLSAADGTYDVSATEAKYQTYNGYKWISEDTYVMPAISLRPTSEDLTQVEISYTTPDGRLASFKGTYLAN